MGARTRARRARRAWMVGPFVAFLRAVRGFVQWLRPGNAWRLGRLLGRLLALAAPGRAVVARNLELACGRPLSGRELRAFSRRTYGHLGLALVEWLRQPLIRAEDLPAMFEPEGLERLRELGAGQEGVIFVAGHAGLWELASHVAGLVGIRLTAVAKFSGHEALDRFVLELRQASGGRVIEAKGSMWALKKALDRKEAVGINVDQEARSNAVYAPFFGVLAATPGTPAQLHLRTGAPIVVATVHRLGPWRYRVTVSDVIRQAPGPDREADVLAITTRINAAMESAIRSHPEQWLWPHRRWRRRPADEPPERAFQRVADARPLAVSPE